MKPLATIQSLRFQVLFKNELEDESSQSSPLCIRVICQKTLLINDCYQTKTNDSSKDNKKDRDSSVPVFVVALNGSRITSIEVLGDVHGPPAVV